MRVNIIENYVGKTGYSTHLSAIEFTNKGFTNLNELDFIIGAVCANFCFCPSVFVATNEYGFIDWVNAIDKSKNSTKYRIICGFINDETYIAWEKA